MTLSKNSNIGFVGAGKVGTSLAIALHNAGYKITGSNSKSISSANNLSDAIPNCKTYKNINDIASHCEILFITTPDDSIESTANSIKINRHNALKTFSKTLLPIIFLLVLFIQCRHFHL